MQQKCDSYSKDGSVENGTTVSDFSRKISSNKGNHVDCEKNKGLDIV